MSSQPYFEHDLLSYNSAYRVLFCRQCNYAIQKSAIQSHLLRHKIYRHRRQDLLRAVAKLPLLNPAEVPCPTSTVLRFPELPVVEGLKCMIDECKHLCASDKRMKRHLAEAHGRERPNGFQNMTRPAKIQSFFRGTQIRYFEVEGPQVSAAASSSHVHRPKINSSIGQPSELSIDLEVLSDYHHYITKTSPSLPIPHATTNGKDHWENTVACNALYRQWLMSGLLAISLWHQVVLDTDANNQAPIVKSGKQRLNIFHQGLSEWRADPAALSDLRVVQVVKQVQSVLNLAVSAALGTLALDKRDFESSWSTDWQCIREDMCRAFCHEEPFSVSSLHEDSGIYDFIGNSGFRVEQHAPPTAPKQSAPISLLATRVKNLPLQMTSAFEKPNAGALPDVLATVAAIELLSEVMDGLIQSDEELNPHTALQGAARWISGTTEHFHNMIIDENPAAFAVLMHWIVLVEGAILSGCWYMRGVTEHVRNHADAILGLYDEEIKRLVAGL